VIPESHHPPSLVFHFLLHYTPCSFLVGLSTGFHHKASPLFSLNPLIIPLPFAFPSSFLMKVRPDRFHVSPSAYGQLSSFVVSHLSFSLTLVQRPKTCGFPPEYLLFPSAGAKRFYIPSYAVFNVRASCFPLVA